jgi:hypothetical protein
VDNLLHFCELKFAQNIIYQFLPNEVFLRILVLYVNLHVLPIFGYSSLPTSCVNVKHMLWR